MSRRHVARLKFFKFSNFIKKDNHRALTNQGFKVRDAAVSGPIALSNGAGTVYTTPSIDTGNVAPGDFLAKGELQVTAPALTATQMPDTTIQTYTVQHSDDNTTFTDLFASCVVQTGASSAGAAAATIAAKPPTGVKRYIRLKIVGTNGSGALGDCSAAKAVLDFLM